MLPQYNQPMTSPLLTESAYPIKFRKADATTLGKHLKLRHSVELVGIKRVGISNFLRFFLYHNTIVPTYISKDQDHIFVPIDLNDLVEREIQPFWILTIKRLADVAEESSIDQAIKQKISALFLQSIQLQDNFLTIENIKKALLLLIAQNLIPTLFLLRFDRMKDAATPEFFNNLQGLIEATHRQLAFVFTSDRPLDQIKPDIFSREELTTFSHVQYLMPSDITDSQIILKTIQKQYDTIYPKNIEQAILKLSGGHMQYLYLAHTIVFEKLDQTKGKLLSPDEVKKLILGDERTTLQSEEIFEGLSKSEQSTIKKLASGKSVTSGPDDKYLFDAGIVQKNEFFSPLFASFLQKKTKSSDSVEFSKKEHLLYSFLLKNKEELCERDSIIHAVWPESEALGVSDWTIDRLVARLRHKLKIQKSEHTIITIKTRGYKLVQS